MWASHQAKVASAKTASKAAVKVPVSMWVWAVFELGEIMEIGNNITAKLNDIG
jgi:hypothetical protein